MVSDEVDHRLLVSYLTVSQKEYTFLHVFRKFRAEGVLDRLVDLSSTEVRRESLDLSNCLLSVLVVVVNGRLATDARGLEVGSERDNFELAPSW